MSVLNDTSFLVAAASPRDAYHHVARTVLRTITTERVVAAPVLPEMFYMLSVRVNYRTAVNMFNTIREDAFRIEALTEADMARMSEIMDQYGDAAFDYVDMSIMVLSERINITEIYTFDHRDFTVFRPAHCVFLELLP